MHVVVGLGNPGARYAGTRHNIGFMVVDRLADHAQQDWIASSATRSEVAAVSLAGSEALLVKPQTFMNRSGLTVRRLRDRLRVPARAFLIVLDDFQLDLGRMRFRRGGSEGGHNGLASVLQEMGSLDIPRLRLGIGAPPAGGEVIDYVLSDFGADDPVTELVERSADAVVYCAESGIEAAMNQYNGN